MSLLSTDQVLEPPMSWLWRNRLLSQLRWIFKQTGASSPRFFRIEILIADSYPASKSGRGYRGETIWGTEHDFFAAKSSFFCFVIGQNVYVVHKEVNMLFLESSSTVSHHFFCVCWQCDASTDRVHVNWTNISWRKYKKPLNAVFRWSLAMYFSMSRMFLRKLLTLQQRLF